MLGLAIAFTTGVVVGSVFIAFVSRKKPLGIIRVDKSDPDGPYLFLELQSDPSDIERNEYVTFKVLVKDYISQK